MAEIIDSRTGEIHEPQSRPAWATYINECWRRSLEGILETGRAIAQAKSELPHGQFEEMVCNDLTFGERTARRLKTIAQDVKLTNRTHGSDLPTEWRTLYELSRLDSETFTRAMQDGLIGPSMQRTDVKKIKRAYQNEQVKSDDAPLPDSGEYEVVYADPPWSYDYSETTAREIENQYPTMSIDDIRALPIQNIISPNAVLFLWATSPKLEDALAVMRDWGFQYRTHAVWDKQKIGMGYYFRQQHELLLVGKRGEIQAPDPSCRIGSVISEPRTKHSAKPDTFYDLIEQMYPNRKKIELFARTARNGWDSWGNQSGQKEAA